MGTKKYSILLVITSIICLSVCTNSKPGYSNNKKVIDKKLVDILWSPIAGRWRVDTKNGILHEKRGFSRKKGYSPLINHNSIITKIQFEKFTKVYFNYSILTASRQPVKILFVFGARDFRNFYAISLSGDKNGINRISLTGSKTKDTTLPRHKKWNFEVTEYNSQPCSIAYNQKNRFSLKFKKKHVTFKADKKIIARFKLPEPANNGMIGFSSKNAKIQLSNVVVYNKRIKVFSDDFKKNSVYNFSKHLRIKRRVIKK